MQNRNEKPISDGQMRMIYALARKLGMENNALHDLVAAVTRQQSIRALTLYQAKQVIDRLQQIMGTDKVGAPDRATDAQIALIFALAKKLGWSDDPMRLRGFLEKRYHVSHPRFLNDTQTRNVTEAMKAMLAGGRGERKKV